MAIGDDFLYSRLYNIYIGTFTTSPLMMSTLAELAGDSRLDFEFKSAHDYETYSDNEEDPRGVTRQNCKGK